MGLLAATLLMVGVRLLFMQTMQRRRERENRQINERLKTLIAAYKTLGGSFTGSLAVNPAHLKDEASAPERQRASTTQVTPARAAMMRFLWRNLYRVGAEPGGSSESVRPLPRIAAARSALPDG